MGNGNQLDTPTSPSNRINCPARSRPAAATIRLLGSRPHIHSEAQLAVHKSKGLHSELNCFRQRSVRESQPLKRSHAPTCKSGQTPKIFETRCGHSRLLKIKTVKRMKRFELSTLCLAMEMPGHHHTDAEGLRIREATFEGGHAVAKN